MLAKQRNQDGNKKWHGIFKEPCTPQPYQLNRDWLKMPSIAPSLTSWPVISIPSCLFPPSLPIELFPGSGGPIQISFLCSPTLPHCDSSLPSVLIVPCTSNFNGMPAAFFCLPNSNRRISTSFANYQADN